MAAVLCPDCPLCSRPPMAVFGGGSQAMCGNDDCTVWTWNPQRSLDDNLLDARQTEWTSTPLPQTEPDPEPEDDQ